MRKAYKSIMSLAVVLIAGLNFIVPAFAQDPFTSIAVGGLSGASGAGLFGSMAGMSGINIGWSSSGSDPMDAMWNVLNPDHVYFSGEKHEATGQGEDIYDYINVDIGDWLDAQSDFIINFAQTYNVSDNDSGSTTVPTVDGIPVNISPAPWYNGANYKYSGQLVAVPLPKESGQTFTGSYGKINLVLANIRVTQSSFSYNTKLYYDNVLKRDSNSTVYNAQSRDFDYITYCYKLNTSTYNIGIWSGISTTEGSWYGISTTPVDESINWKSDILNLDIFNGWNSAKVKIPKSISQLEAGWTLPDFLDELDRIWTGAGEDNIIIENGSEDPPVPPVPVPDTPLGNVPFDDWVDLWGQGIFQQLENQSDALDLIGSNGEDAIEDLESIDSNLDDLQQTAESIDTNIGIGNGILGGIRSLAQSAVDYLQGIAEHVGELVEEIVEGTETLISGILNQIPQAFGVIFGPIKQASSIWHYVVEWIQSISAPFQFIWSMASGTSYYIILPVYASLAAAVVLAFYKRFGK